MSASVHLIHEFRDRTALRVVDPGTTSHAGHGGKNVSPLGRCTEFGPFCLFPSERRLVKQGEPVAIGSRALDLLILLVEQAGSVVTKRELMARVWPDITVEECSLRVHIASLRKALGDRQNGACYIANSAGRGYSFVGRTTRCDVLRDMAPAMPFERATGLPRPSMRMIGRDEDVRAVSNLLATHRFVTIHGPGGIGKTSVSLAVAHSWFDRYEDGVCFLDLGLRNCTIPEVLAFGLGLVTQSSNLTLSIIDYLRGRRMLLILDCCEHVVDSTATLAETIFQEAPQVSILATSREPLRAEGEHVYTLAPLQTPPGNSHVSAERLATYPAAELFLERAASAGQLSGLSDADAQIVADICCKVDGVPLAIELAASRVGTLGLRETAGLLDDQRQLRWQGRRTAPARHQSLHATLDWSYDLLTERERGALRRLSLLAGPFTLDDAQVAATEIGIDAAEFVEALAQLVNKSLIFADVSKEVTRYRFLSATRAYAQAKLAETG